MGDYIGTIIGIHSPIPYEAPDSKAGTLQGHLARPLSPKLYTLPPCFGCRFSLIIVLYGSKTVSGRVGSRSIEVASCNLVAALAVVGSCLYLKPYRLNALRIPHADRKSPNKVQHSPQSKQP